VRDRKRKVKKDTSMLVQYMDACTRGDCERVVGEGNKWLDVRVSRRMSIEVVVGGK
jgi:hypothetical protein